MSLWRRLRYLLPSYRRAEEQDIQEELESLRGMVRPGELGNLTLAAENARGVWGWSWLENIRQDIRYSVRTHRRRWLVTVVCVFSIAVGVGANTLGFSLLNTLLLRSLPLPAIERLVVLGFNPPDRPQPAGDGGGFSRANCVAFREQKSVFEDFGCYAGDVAASLADDSKTVAPERLRGQLFTAGLARALGVKPLIGRWFTEADERQGADRVLLISHSLWARRFGGTPDVLGKRVLFDSEPATVIGVMPDEFEFLSTFTQYWAPLRSLDDGTQSPARIFDAVARLRPGIDIKRAQSEIAAFAERFGEVSPDDKGWWVHLQPLDVYVSDEFRTSALTLQGIVGFVLLIACANVAGLLLTQGMTQHRELAVRAALGSSRWRIVRQLLTHSLVLAAAGSVLGLVLARWGLQFLRNALPAGLPRAFYISPLDSNVLIFTFLVSIVCGLAAGIAPAFHMSRINPQDVLRESGRSATSGVSHQRLRSAFVVVQLALAFVLLVGAGLMINSQMRIANQSIGFDLDNLLAVQLDLPDAKFRRPSGAVPASRTLAMEIDPQIRIVSEQIRRNLEVIPSVISASGIGIHPPLSGALNMPIRIDGDAATEQQRAQFLPVMGGYFRTLQIPLIQGREFGSGDKAGSVQVAIVNETMARRFRANETALGKYVQIQSPMMPNEPPREIIGIVGEVKQYLGQESRPQLYLPYAQLPLVHDESLTGNLRNVTFVIRTSAPAAQLATAITAAVSAADAGQAVTYIQSMRQTVFGNQRRRVYAGFIVTFGAIALVLAMVGVYGVIAQLVNQRTNEIGIRMALGADARQVHRMVIREGGVLIGIGLLIGTAGAAAVTRVIRSNLFGVSPTDPLTFALALALLAVIALAACYIPARRASRIDPMLALRHE